VVKGLERLLERSLTVPLVHLVEVDVVSAESAQAGFSAADDVVPGQTGIVGPFTHGHPHLGRNEHVIAIRAQRLAEDLLRGAA